MDDASNSLQTTISDLMDQILPQEYREHRRHSRDLTDLIPSTKNTEYDEVAAEEGVQTEKRTL